MPWPFLYIRSDLLVSESGILVRRSATILLLAALASGLAPASFASLIGGGEVACTMACADTDRCCCKPKVAAERTETGGPALSARGSFCPDGCAVLGAGTKTLSGALSAGFRATATTLDGSRSDLSKSISLSHAPRWEDSGPRGPPRLPRTTI